VPTGTVAWYDPRDETGDIKRKDRHYAVTGSDMQPAARETGARVHFDIARIGRVEHAVNVRRLTGTRTAPAHSRTGDLSGAHHPDDKGGDARTRQAGDIAWRLSGRPAELVRQWALALAGDDADLALPLYASNALVHANGKTWNGRNEIRTFLYGHGLIGSGIAQPRIRGTEGDFDVQWPEMTARPARTARLRVAHGQIVEQWGPDLDRP
jgi:hypothetical protein